MSAPALRVLAFVATVHALDQTQLERYDHGRLRRYQLDLPGKQPITIVESEPSAPRPEWLDITLTKDKDHDDIRNIMTDIIHDPAKDKPRCYGPSCQEGFIEDEGPQGDLEEYLSEYADKIKDYREFSSDRLQAISSLANKLKNERLKVDYLGQSYPSSATPEEDGSGKVYTAWNRLKVKKHKHPYDDKDGWVTLEPVAWSTSKISKWKPNVKNQKPMSWNDDDERYPSNNNDGFYQTSENVPSYYPPQKKPSVIRPAYINNKLHMSSTTDWDAEVPSKPSWNKPQAQASYNYPTSWSPDDSRRPLKPTCDSEETHNNDDTVYYGISDTVVTDNRPSQFPYEYEALKRPLRRPTQVVYAGSPEIDNDRTTRPSSFSQGNGQWVLLSTTKGYRNKKRQRSLFDSSDEGLNSNQGTIMSHQAVALTVLPADSDRTNMTTSHGGLLEVERSFKTVEESKREMDKENELRPDLSADSTDNQSSLSQIVRRRVVGTGGAAPDSAAVLAAVGAGMVPATMAMVLPMMIGRRRRRDIQPIPDGPTYQNTYFKFE